MSLVLLLMDGLKLCSEIVRREVGKSQGNVFYSTLPNEVMRIPMREKSILQMI